jgi:hypothetical protein
MQCSMRALVKGEKPETFDEEPDEHMKRCHPDPVETQRERQELEKQMTALYEKQKKR